MNFAGSFINKYSLCYVTFIFIVIHSQMGFTGPSDYKKNTAASSMHNWNQLSSLINNFIKAPNQFLNK